jgi:two-component system cell cycle response regulator DivK
MIAAKTVLLVEDDPWHRSAATDLLEGEGYDVLHAASGSQALRLARERHPAVILLDLALPDGNGLETFLRLQRSACTRGIPVIVVSAYADLVRARDVVGTERVIRKPYDVSNLLRCVNEAVCAGSGPPGCRHRRGHQSVPAQDRIEAPAPQHMSWRPSARQPGAQSSAIR